MSDEQDEDREQETHAEYLERQAEYEQDHALDFTCAFPGRCVKMTATPEQIELLRHACGMDGRDPYYRDYFCAVPGQVSDLAWRAMQAAGWAEVRREPGPREPYRTWGVTDAGKRLIGKDPRDGKPCFK